MSGYEVQGRRRTAGDPSRQVREDVRLTATDDRNAALTAARAMVADGFTVWVLAVDRRSGGRAYSLVTRLPSAHDR